MDKNSIFNLLNHKLALHDIYSNQIHAEMLRKQNMIDVEEAHLLISGLEKIKNDIKNNQIIFNKEYEDIYMDIEILLYKEIGDTAKKLHMARSRNAQIALVLKLFLKVEVKIILDQLHQLLNTIHNIAKNHKETFIPDYRPLQKAQPVSLENHLNAYYNMFSRDIERHEDCYKRMNFCPLGAEGYADAEFPLPIDRYFVAEKLGFTGMMGNTLDALSDRDFVIEFTHCSSITIMHLSRFCEDLVIWATDEFNFIKFDEDFLKLSSSAPSKEKSHIPGFIHGKTQRIFGNLMNILTKMKVLPLRFNQDMQEDKKCLFDTISTMQNCLGIFISFLECVDFQKETLCKSSLNSSMCSARLFDSIIFSETGFS